MPTYKSGKITTGVQHGMSVNMAESGDVEKAKPKAPPTATTFKAKRLPLNIVGPRGQNIEFDGGYFVTKDKKLIEYIKEEFGELCDIC